MDEERGKTAHSMMMREKQKKYGNFSILNKTLELVYLKTVRRLCVCVGVGAPARVRV